MLVASAAPKSASPPAVAARSFGLTTGDTVADARRRLDAYLSSKGFRFEEEGRGRGYVFTATRMADAAGGLDDTVCSLRALHRPTMSTTTLDIRLAPGPSGVEVAVNARFVELDLGLVSGALSKRACRSRGVLEAEVRRAARGG